MNLIYKEETISTNDDVKALGFGNATHGTAVYTFNQTSGRGRFGRPWLANPGEGLAMSLLLRPEEGISTGGITLGAAAAVCRLLTGWGLQPQIKWPNDVLLDYGKVCGILAEGFLGAEPPFIVVGMGFNVNNTAFPGVPQGKAASVFLHTGRRRDMHETAIELAALCLESYRGLAEPVGMSALVREYSALCVNLGREAVALSLNGETRGVAEAIDAEGALIIRTAEGLRRVVSGEVTLSTG